MTLDTPKTMYGVRKFEERRNGLAARDWAKLRTGEAFTIIPDIEGEILAFFDIAPRDEFLKIFGGESVRLDRTRRDDNVDISKLIGSAA